MRTKMIKWVGAMLVGLAVSSTALAVDAITAQQSLALANSDWTSVYNALYSYGGFISSFDSRIKNWPDTCPTTYVDSDGVTQSISQTYQDTYNNSIETAKSEYDLYTTYYYSVSTAVGWFLYPYTPVQTDILNASTEFYAQNFDGSYEDSQSADQMCQNALCFIGYLAATSREFMPAFQNCNWVYNQCNKFASN